MKSKHVDSARSSARATLAWCGIEVGSSYLTLRPTHVEKLLQCMREANYQRPPHCKGAPARHFHDLLQARAQGKNP